MIFQGIFHHLLPAFTQLERGDHYKLIFSSKLWLFKRQLVSVIFARDLINFWKVQLSAFKRHQSKNNDFQKVLSLKWLKNLQLPTKTYYKTFYTLLYSLSHVNSSLKCVTEQQLLLYAFYAKQLLLAFIKKKFTKHQQLIIISLY